MATCASGLMHGAQCVACGAWRRPTEEPCALRALPVVVDQLVTNRTLQLARLHRFSLVQSEVGVSPTGEQRLLKVMATSRCEGSRRGFHGGIQPGTERSPVVLLSPEVLDDLWPPSPEQPVHASAASNPLFDFPKPRPPTSHL